MAKIKASGFITVDGDKSGWMQIEIEGDKNVRSIKSNRPILAEYMKKEISEARYQLIPCYTPRPNTMLQALATLQHYFDMSDISTEGDIGEVEYEDYHDGEIY